MVARYVKPGLHQSDVRDRVEDYFGVKGQPCRLSSLFSKELLQLVHLPLNEMY